MMIYPWAANRQKLERAIGELGPDATEDALKARYIEMAGLVLSDEGASVVETVEEPVVEDEKPKKSKKK